jgi:hypothetical protein
LAAVAATVVARPTRATRPRPAARDSPDTDGDVTMGENVVDDMSGTLLDD